MLWHVKYSVNAARRRRSDGRRAVGAIMFLEQPRGLVEQDVHEDPGY